MPDPAAALSPTPSAAVDGSLKRLIAALCAIYVVLLGAYATTLDGQFDVTAHPVGRDFINYWSGPVLAFQDKIGVLFDPVRYHLAQEALVGRPFAYHVWSYPPTLLLLIAPLAALPYFPAFVLWSVAGWFIWVRTALRGPWWSGHWRSSAGLTVVLAPAALVNVFFGQNGFLTALLFVGGFRLLMKHPLLAGGLFGLLTFKPQIGILIPVALVAAGRYRTVLAAGLTAVLMAVAAGLVFGWDAWAGYLDKVTPFQRLAMETATGPFLLWVTTPFMSGRLMDLPIPLCYGIQAIFTAVMIVTTWQIWRGERSFEIKLAFTTAAAILATPYSLAYDLTIPSVGALLFFLFLRNQGFVLRDVLALASLWTLPLLLPAYNNFLPVAGPVILSFFCWRVWQTPLETAAIART